MNTYILLINWTEQGIRNVKDSPNRLDAARDAARDAGGDIKAMYLTIGPYDLVSVLEAPDDEAVATFVLKVAAGGNIRTTTLKAFPEDDYRRILGAL